MLSKMEMVQAAIAELREATNEDLVAFILTRWGVRIDVKFIPIFRASLHDKQRVATERGARVATSTAPAL